MCPSEVHSYLNSFINFEIRPEELNRANFKLDRVRALWTAISPLKGFAKVIHVAGTKGKGSTCAMTARILQEVGFSVGVYTSPHLLRYNERIRIAALNFFDPDPGSLFPDEITDKELTDVVRELQPQIDQFQRDHAALGRVSFFEIFTVLAMFYFLKRKVDVIVLETGLGGRLDATNIFDSDIAAITPISFEHTHILGNTLSEIAQEKAGIIKDARQQILIARQSSEAMDVLVQKAKSVSASWKIAEALDQYDGRLKGKHQALNAGLAAEIVRALNVSGDIEPSIIRGLRAVHWPGRFEVMDKGRPVILDCAHNEESMQTLVKTFQQEFCGHRAVVVFGASEDKDTAKMVETLRPIAEKMIYTQANHPRAKVFNDTSPKQAIDAALGENMPVVVTGSVFLVAQVRKILESKNVSV